MIDHKTKCIFVHIQRTGGTIIEKQLMGNDLWWIEPESKHLIASRMKKKYAEYWNDYFKFSIIRDPWARTVSMLRFPEEFYIQKDRNTGKLVNVQSYIDKYTLRNNCFIETDTRFVDPRFCYDENKHKLNQVYLNILDEELDYIGKYENLEETLSYISSKIGVNLTINARQGSISYDNYFTEETKEMITSLYENDLKHFNYSYGDGKLITNY